MSLPDINFNAGVDNLRLPSPVMVVPQVARLAYTSGIEFPVSMWASSRHLVTTLTVVTVFAHA